MNKFHGPQDSSNGCKYGTFAPKSRRDKKKHKKANRFIETTEQSRVKNCDV